MGRGGIQAFQRFELLSNEVRSIVVCAKTNEIANHREQVT
jgi:hypothetical protein